MNKRIITVLMILSIITISVIPFSVKAAGNLVYATGGTFDEGEYNVYTAQASSGSYLQFYAFDKFYSFDQYHSAVIVKIDLDNYYTGDITLNFTVNYTTFALWWTECESGSCGIDGINKQFILHLNDCQNLTLYLCSNQTSTNGIQPNSIDSSGIYPSIYNNMNISYNTISNLRLSWSNDPNSTQNTVILNNYNKNYYFKSLSMNSLVRVDSKFKIDSVVNGNYIMCKYSFILQGSNVSPDSYNNFDGLRFQYRNFEGTLTNITIFEGDDFGFYKYVEFNTTRNAYILTLYIPLGAITPTNDPLYTYDFNFYNFELNNVTSVGFMYGGVVDSLPEQKVNDNTSEDINDIANEFTDIKDQEHNITTDFDNNLTDFKNNVNLQDYDFISGITTTTNYFKLQLENVFNMSAALRAMWVIPVICIVLMRLLGG